LRSVTPQVSRCLAPIYINYFLMYLGSETPLGSPGTSPGTLSSWVGDGGRNPILRRATGKYLLSYFGRLLYWYMWRGSTRFGSIQHEFEPLWPGGSKSQKLGLRPNAACGCFALLGECWRMYLTGFHTLLLLLHSFLPPREMQTCLDTLLVPTFYPLVSVIQHVTHMFPSLLRVDNTSRYVFSVTQCRPANFSLWVNIFASSSFPLVFNCTRNWKPQFSFIC
jgi:hypothetical protein